jgi:hypothetical protein
VGQAAQHGEAPADRVGPGREPLVRQRLPGREHRDLVRAEQAAQRVRQVVGLAAGGGDREHRTAGAAGRGRTGHRGDHERAQCRRRGEVEGVGVDTALRREVTGTREPTVAQGGRDQTGKLHGRLSWETVMHVESPRTPNDGGWSPSLVRATDKKISSAGSDNMSDITVEPC